MVGESETKASLRIILIDDDPFDVKLIEATLRASLNCHVTAVDSKAALMAYLWRELPDVVISDTNIPGFDGLKVLELMQRLHPGVPFVFCSGTVSSELRVKLILAGARALVSKSDLEGLVAVVKRECGLE